MKEKIKKMFQYICTWKFVMWLNIAFVVYYAVSMFVEIHAAYITAMLCHGGYALTAWIVSNYEERQSDYERFISLMAQDYRKELAKLNRYKTRYGELPPDGPQTEVPQTEDPATKEPEAEKQQADTPSASPEVNADKPKRKRPVANRNHVSGKFEKASPKSKPVSKQPAAAPRKPRTKKNKEEQS